MTQDLPVQYTALPWTSKPSQFEQQAVDYVYKSWSDSWRYSPWRGMVNDRDYKTHYAPIIESSVRALSESGGLWLAHHPDTSLREFYGWAGVELAVNCLHYSYVTLAYRNKKFMRGCIEAAGMNLKGLTYSWRTVKAQELARVHQWKYNPNYGRALQRLYSSTEPSSGTGGTTNRTQSSR